MDKEFKTTFQPYVFTAAFGVGIASFVDAASDSAEIALRVVILPDVNVKTVDSSANKDDHFTFTPHMNSQTFCVTSSSDSLPLNLHVQGRTDADYHMNNVSIGNNSSMPLDKVVGPNCGQGKLVQFTSTASTDPTILTVMPE